MKELYTTREAAAYLGLAPASIGVYIRKGALVAVKHGRDWFISHDELVHYRQEYRGRVGRRAHLSDNRKELP